MPTDGRRGKAGDASMVSVGIVAADKAVSVGLGRLFSRQPSVRSVELPLPLEGAAEAAPDLIVIDVWPPSAGRAESLCSTWHQRYPAAAVVAVVHRPSAALLARLRRFGATALWPKGEVRELPAFALGLLGRRGAPAPAGPGAPEAGVRAEPAHATLPPWIRS